ncbi:hypothetical protein HUT16_11685 [Kitasatospora sp. NA04385]|uniref:hypothetical protein n=1 Tax=Kitasatospora sp. NA04385 TaxID=2742135 RepID=UPI00159009FE|nr:hypothetical protein [Kitasatospora sp. NA04385]QKW19637.1 hypothetical protein HUT16_11685 [Kitasatospora sp. NA04385]
MLAAQVLGLGLGAADARAADAGHPPRHPGRTLGTPVRTGADDGGPLDGTVEGTIRTVDGLDPADAVDARPVQGLGDALGQQLGGELPLPGHHADRPDAFSLAAGLLSAVPPQPRAADDAPGLPLRPRERPRAAPRPRPHPPSRPSAPRRRRPAGATTTPAPAGTAAATATAARTPARRPAPALDTPPPPAPRPGPDRLALTAAPAHPAAGSAVAVLLPIAAGLLLTAAAMYKHRGLPGGH